MTKSRDIASIGSQSPRGARFTSTRTCRVEVNGERVASSHDVCEGRGGRKKTRRVNIPRGDVAMDKLPAFRDDDEVARSKVASSFGIARRRVLTDAVWTSKSPLRRHAD